MSEAKPFLAPHGALPAATVVLATAFCLGSPEWMPLIGLGDVEHAEGRELSAAPAWPEDYEQLASYAERYEKHFEEHLPMRGRFLAWHSWWCREVLETSNTDQVVIGRDGWLYFTEERLLEDHVGLTHDRETSAKAWRDALVERRDAMKMRGIPYVFFVAPNKVTVVPEGLPERWERADGVKTRLQAISEALGDGQLPYFDQSALLRGLPKEPPPYLRTDSHWSAHGAHASYTQIASHLHKLGALSAPLPLERFVVDMFPNHGDLAVLLRDQREEDKELWAFFHARPPLVAKEVKAPEGFKFPPELGVWEPPRFFENPKAEGRLLLLGDSFMYAQMKWWAEHFRNAAFIPCAVKSTRHFEFFVDGLQPSLVIELRAERNMRWPPTTRRQS